MNFIEKYSDIHNSMIFGFIVYLADIMIPNIFMIIVTNIFIIIVI